jgi:hypothetical protein
MDVAFVSLMSVPGTPACFVCPERTLIVRYDGRSVGALAYE